LIAGSISHHDLRWNRRRYCTPGLRQGDDKLLTALAFFVIPANAGIQSKISGPVSMQISGFAHGAKARLSMVHPDARANQAKALAVWSQSAANRSRHGRYVALSPHDLLTTLVLPC
jgi:hypothetical protein